MANNNTSVDITATTKPATIANELYRIHCYADTLAKLCSAGSSVTIAPAQLEQIFEDIAQVTDRATALIYDNSIEISEIAGSNGYNHFRTLAEAVTK